MAHPCAKACDRNIVSSLCKPEVTGSIPVRSIGPDRFIHVGLWREEYSCHSESDAR
jgi:hypothetical protein